MPQPPNHPTGPSEIPITIDKEPVKAPKTPMTRQEIRQLRIHRFLPTRISTLKNTVGARTC